MITGDPKENFDSRKTKIKDENYQSLYDQLVQEWYDSEQLEPFDEAIIESPKHTSPRSVLTVSDIWTTQRIEMKKTVENMCTRIKNSQTFRLQGILSYPVLKNEKVGVLMRQNYCSMSP